MAAVKDIKINNYCDAVNDELLGMKNDIHRLQDDAKKVYGEEASSTGHTNGTCANSTSSMKLSF
jgi:hypothetical protein